MAASYPWHNFKLDIFFPLLLLNKQHRNPIYICFKRPRPKDYSESNLLQGFVRGKRFDHILGFILFAFKTSFIITLKVDSHRCVSRVHSVWIFFEKVWAQNIALHCNADVVCCVCSGVPTQFWYGVIKNPLFCLFRRYQIFLQFPIIGDSNYYPALTFANQYAYQNPDAIN